MTDCGQAIYGGCAGEECDRDCFAKVIINLDAKTAPKQAKGSRLMLLLVLAAMIPVFCAAVYYGLSKAEYQYQMDRRV